MTPLEVVVDALEAHDCRPRRGMALCPAHDDRSPSLSIGEGRAGDALVHCFAGCHTADVLAKVGLTWSDLFVDAPRRERRARAPRGPRSFADVLLRRAKPVGERAVDAETVLDQLTGRGITWRPSADPHLWTVERCPCCGMPGAVLIHEDEHGRVVLSCPNGCAQRDISRVLHGGIPWTT